MDSILLDMPDNPVPDNHTAGYFAGHAGRKLRYAVFRSHEPVARGTVVLVQGRNECIEKYYELVRELTARGLWVATYDLRGQGGSERLIKNPLPGYVRRFADYEQDLEIFLETVVLPDTRLPFFLVAHSTGALIALSAAPRLANRIDRMAMTAPFLGIANLRMPKVVAYWLLTFLSTIGFAQKPYGKDLRKQPFEDNPLTSDPGRFDRNNAIAAARPELTVGPPAIRWIREAMKTIRRVTQPEHLRAITIPTIMISPVNDAVVSFAAQEDVSRDFRAGFFIPVYGSRHEILQERDIYRAQAIAAINAFIPGSDAEVAGAELQLAD
ncbi:alpha/beta hydrolase [Rhizobiaceae bacterium n13]|uniref:Alpha/beta hydrolase n=1 Tax=Ferirhizobium litorale TaxID=2927786 RepID=A0AAE3QB80_9HYPH|nr:alpha/beta hydrolase [Fererhizobium litorale]MDI7860505.1 alpha/beta hydrolase [Fererhizobium litorale]MDI7920640.1 alpha/beta hydrolase [Fererhizobium litorale]